MENSPEIRFPEFRDSWSKSKLGKLLQVTTGNKDTKDKEPEGSYPFFVRSDNVERINSYSYDGEAILTSGDGVGVGKNFHYINGRFDYHQRVYCLYEFSDEVEGKFIYHFFSKAFYKRVMRLSAKNSVDSVRMDMITEMPIRHPSLEEQQKIANFLSSVDQKIQQLRRKKELLEEYKKGVMQKLFSQEIRFKDENGDDFPDWESKRLEEILDINYGKDYKQLGEGNIPLIGTGGILGYVDDFLYDKPSVLIGRKGTIDKPQYIEKPFWTVDTLFYTKVNKSVDPYFAYLLVSRINLLKYNEASGVPSLSVRSLNSIKVKLPASFKEQLRIANFVKNIDEKISHIEVKIELTQIFKKGLLQKMFV